MSGREVAATLEAVLDSRLAPAGEAPLDAPIAVAVSGGGDSLALLVLTCAWAARRGRRVLALNVDHGLQAESGAWAVRCAETAAALGADFRALRWRGGKPVTGLAAAARAARHALLADAARAAGASVILMGHTADDLLEAALMRAEGSTNPDPREWSPSPAWPEGRGVFLLRPLLRLRRADLRAWLAGQGLAWIEDPANENPASARARARARLAQAEAAPAAPTSRQSDQGSAAAAVDPLTGAIVLPRDAPARALAAACLCAAGTARPPRGERLARLKERLAAGEDFVATLAGARIETQNGTVRVCRNAGEVARGGLAALDLVPGAATVWDGRYELTAQGPGVTVRALGGLASRLSQGERRRLKAVPAAARAGLPALVYLSGTMICPILADAPDVRIRALTEERFEAAMGLVQREIRA
jgi:tRNA(Ile)-lysidine synthase